VPSMFGVGIIIPLIKGHNMDGSSSDNYRGITLNVHLCKVLEMCILDIYGNYFVTSDLHFSFEKRVGCNDALYALQSVVRHFTNGNSTVNQCALDMSKAFDVVNHFALFMKCMNCNVPIALLNILVNWYGMCTAVVRWDNVFSDVIRLQCGVRQGGVLSPVLFTVYVNDVIMALSASGYGYYFHGMFVGCFMYADDLLLLYPSLCDLQLISAVLNWKEFICV